MTYLMKTTYFYKGLLGLCVLFILGNLGTASYALEGLSLADAGFTLTKPAKEKTPENFKTTVKYRETPIFFWTRVVCRTDQCKTRLESGKVKLIHKWVRMYAVKPKIEQVKKFSADDLKNFSVWSDQEMKYPGRWFVEVSTSDGEVLCLGKTCKFTLSVK